MKKVKVNTLWKVRDVPVGFVCTAMKWLAEYGHLGQRHHCEDCFRLISNSEHEEGTIVEGGAPGPVKECITITHLERMP